MFIRPCSHSSTARTVALSDLSTEKRTMTVGEAPKAVLP